MMFWSSPFRVRFCTLFLVQLPWCIDTHMSYFQAVTPSYMYSKFILFASLLFRNLDSVFLQLLNRSTMWLWLPELQFLLSTVFNKLIKKRENGRHDENFYFSVILSHSKRNALGIAFLFLTINSICSCVLNPIFMRGVLRRRMNS